MLVFSQISHDCELGLENVISLGPACVDFESTIKAQFKGKGVSLRTLGVPLLGYTSLLITCLMKGP